MFDELTSRPEPFRNELARFVFYRTYSRWLDSEGRREKWHETVERYCRFIFGLAENKLTEEEQRETMLAIYDHEALGSNRLLWSAGPACMRQGMVAYNCSALDIDCLEAFSEVMYILMCGTGVGASVEYECVEKLPRIIKRRKNTEVESFMIEDSREGWANALLYGLKAWFDGRDVAFDYSELRPAGARLMTMGGRSSGPLPLKRLLEFARDRIQLREGRRLSTIDAADIVNMIGEVVVAGGVRRSAEILLFSPDDPLMLSAKRGAFWQSHPYRAMANNSIAYDTKPSSVEFMHSWMELAESGSGEPGFFNREAWISTSPRRKKFDRTLTNPCVTGDTIISTVDGPRTFAELAETEADVLVHAIDLGTWLPGIRYMRRPHKTAESEPILRITLDTGLSIRLTYKNQLITSYGTKCAAEELYVGQSLATCNPMFTNPTIMQIQYDGYEDVYNGCVDDVHTYAILDPKSLSLEEPCGIYSANCGEISLRSAQTCNLSTVIARPTDSFDDLMKKIRVATRIGTLQSLISNFPFLRNIWTQNQEEERLLGVSITGIADCPLLRDPEVLRELRAYAIQVNAELADRLGINRSVAITTVKPEGTTSQYVDTSSGLHVRWSPFYIRRVRIASSDPLFQMMRTLGVPVEPEVGQEPTSATTWVLSFPVKSPEGALTRHDVKAIEQLEYWLNIKKNYTEHNPSCTIYVKDDEWLEVGAWVHRNWDLVQGLSFLPSNNHVYPMAPYEEITEEQYLELLSSFPEAIDYDNLKYFEHDDNTEGAKSYACTGGACEIP